MQTEFVKLLRSNKIEILCNIIVTTALGAARAGFVPCEVHKQEQDLVSFLPECGKVADSRHCSLRKDQSLLFFFFFPGGKIYIKTIFYLFNISFCIICK